MAWRCNKKKKPVLSLLVALAILALTLPGGSAWSQAPAGNAQSISAGETLSVNANGEATRGTANPFGEDGAAESGATEGGDADAASTPSAPIGRGAGTTELPALIYPDTVSIIRFDTKRVDYDTFKLFLADFIHGAIGSLNSGDKYLNKFREEQKEEIKASVADLLDSMRATFAESLWANGVSEFYRIRYEEGANFCQIIALPLAGVGADSQQVLIDYMKEHYDPISCFSRFGFLIAVVDHTSATAEAEKEDAKAMLLGDFSGSKKKEKKKKAEKSGATAAGDEDQAETTVSSRQLIRREVLPALRKRFLNPADPQASVADALSATNGAAVSVIMPNTASVLRWLDFLNKNGLAFDFEPVKQALSAADIFQWASFNVSLVGSPRLVILSRLKSSQAATQFATLFSAAIAGYQTLLNEQLNAQVQELELPFETNPFIAMLDPVFKGLKSEAKGNDAAITLDLNILKENATAFIPLFGGVPSGEQKKKPEPGVEEIDFGDDNALPEVEEAAEATETEGMEEGTEAPAEPEPEAEPEDAIDEDDPFA
ncbi:MAG: hypothetical protein Q4G68_13595 [Planctomycetia bacterium]|nr:hypothetical protein [Planctomycetia bacterium]